MKYKIDFESVNDLEDSIYEGLVEHFLKDSFLEPKVSSFKDSEIDFRDFYQEPEIDFENLEIKSIALIPRYRDKKNNEIWRFFMKKLY